MILAFVQDVTPSSVPATAGPSVTDWIQAIGSAVSAIGIVLALAAYLYQRRRDREQDNRETERQAYERAAQATLVYAMYDLTDSHISCSILNNSDRPVYLLGMMLAPGPWPTHGDFEALPVPRDLVIPPHDRFQKDYEATEKDFVERSAQLRIVIMFIDAAGQSWQRQEMKPPEPLSPYDMRTVFRWFFSAQESETRKSKPGMTVVFTQ